MDDEHNIDGQVTAGSDPLKVMRTTAEYGVMLRRVRLMYAVGLPVLLVPAVAWPVLGLGMAAVLTLVVGVPTYVVILFAYVAAIRARRQLYSVLPVLREHYWAFNLAILRDIFRPSAARSAAP